MNTIRLARAAALALLTTLALCAEETKGPKPIPADKQEEISRVMLGLQSAQVKVLAIKAQAAEAEAELSKTNDIYAKMLDKLRSEYGAGPRCVLTVDKQWSCPPAAENPQPAKKETK